MPQKAERDVSFRRGYLLWLSLGAVACLPTIGVTPFASLAIASALAAVWIVSNIPPKRLVASLLISAIDIFFREFVARNRFKVPPTNMPTIFVCAPHSNQFLDPFVVMSAVARMDLCYLAAAKTVRLRFVGLFARLLESIPVERVDDVAFKGSGHVWISPEDRVTVLGRGTAFTSQLKPGDSIVVGELGPTAVSSITSDEQLTLKKPAPTREVSEIDDPPVDGYVPYRINPWIDQSSMFDAVHDALRAGKAIGIFPEGGSHDRPSMLPFKAGVAIMALGALAKQPDLPLRLVPVGLNYFSGHRFRSRVFVDIGEPLTVPMDLQQRYAAGGDSKRAATTELMTMVNSALAAVTISAPDYETLEFFWTLRRLVKGDATHSSKMSLDQQTELARRFATGYDRQLADGRLWRDTERVRAIRSRTAEYNARLKSLRLRDYQVANVMGHMTRLKAIRLFIGRFLRLLAASVLWLPITLLSIPLLVTSRLVAAFKARQAVSKSKVKIYGRDVAATWKVIVALVLLPVLWWSYTELSGAFAAWAGLNEKWQQETKLLTFFLLPVTAYAFILLGEQMLLIWRSLCPLLVLALQPTKAQELVEERHQLQAAMKELVDAEGWRTDLEPTPRMSSVTQTVEPKLLWPNLPVSPTPVREPEAISADALLPTPPPVAPVETQEEPPPPAVMAPAPDEVASEPSSGQGVPRECFD